MKLYDQLQPKISLAGSVVVGIFIKSSQYRVTAIKMDEDGSRKVFILDKKDGQSMGFTPDELIREMPEILKLQKRGENIYYTPLSEDKHHILIDDVSPEDVVRLQKDGYKPSAIIESSPRNFQCVLTIPKFGGEFDRQIANQLAAMLNKEYGDPKLSGAIHPHRAPGFANRKPKHRQKTAHIPYRCFALRFSKFAKRLLWKPENWNRLSWQKCGRSQRQFLRQPSRQVRKRPILPITKISAHTLPLRISHGWTQ